MKPISELVRAKLQAQAGQQDAVALWARLWTAYEKGGPVEATSLLAALLESQGEDGEGFEGGRS